ncbi:MAG: aromatic ring-hydroxylating oxygenase subunit alpha, partial [Candidatus Binatia bacterium]
MNHSTQVRLIRQALESIERGSPPMAEHPTRNDPTAYTSPGRDAREREVLFRAHPLVVGFSSELREPGDYLADELPPVPVLVVRNSQGALRAFANICRHRGSRVVHGSGRGATRFICPYHGWSYDRDGGLKTIPDEEGFSGIDRERYGLIPLPVEEKHGLVWVLPRPGGSFRVEDVVGGLAEDLDSYRIDSYELREVRRLERRMNWKLMSDTFWEAYHIKVLHKQNVAPMFVKNLALFDAFGRSQRLVGIRSSIATLAERPESEWDLIPHATILMNLFPNTILVMQSDHLEMYRIFPVSDRVNESVIEVSLLVPRGSEASANERSWQRTMELLVGVIEQDFGIGEGIQRSFEAGVLPEV